jgi:hypothetical protein
MAFHWQIVGDGGREESQDVPESSLEEKRLLDLPRVLP